MKTERDMGRKWKKSGYPHRNLKLNPYLKSLTKMNYRWIRLKFQEQNFKTFNQNVLIHLRF